MAWEERGSPQDPAARAVAEEREREPGRGRHARSPLQIPLAGYVDVAHRVRRELHADHVAIVAAGIAFYLMLAIAPLLIVVVTVYGLVLDVSALEQQLSQMAGSLPPSAAALVRDQVRYVISADRGALGVGLVLALLAALYGASRATDALIVGVNIAYDEHETRSSLKRRLLAVAVTAGVVVAVGLAFALIVGLEHGARQLVAVLRWPVLALVAVVGLLLLYRHAPCRRPAKWRWLSVGTVVASALWLAGTGVFSAVVTRFSTLSETYGALAGVIVLMLWLLLTAFAILLGAEVNSELEHQTCVDTTVGDELPVGTRGAAKADLLGPRFELRLPWRRRDDEGPDS